MSTLEILLTCEAVAAIVIIMVIIAVAAALRRRKRARDRLYDPYGLYAPITAAQLAELDRAAQVHAEAKQIQQMQSCAKYAACRQCAWNTQNTRDTQYAACMQCAWNTLNTRDTQ